VDGRRLTGVACATARYRTRELGALDHQVRPIPARYAKAYVKHDKNDAACTAPICDSVMSLMMRFADPGRSACAGDGQAC
jgi:hypothetical protein